MTGFLGTRADVFMDLAITFFVAAPFLMTYAIRLAARGKYRAHRNLQAAEEPAIQIPAAWMHAPVADTPNNWVQVRRDGDTYVAAVGQETFDVELSISLESGRILRATMVNPVETVVRDCTDVELTDCGEPRRRRIFRRVEMLAADWPGHAQVFGTEGRMTTKINVDESCNRLDETWSPRVVATLNGQEVKLVRAKGVFPWHRHDDADEFFLVWKGQFSVEFRDRRIDMKDGECVLVPRGVEHRTSAAEDAYVLCFEPVGTVNTGNLPPNDFTAPCGVSILGPDEAAE